MALPTLKSTVHFLTPSFLHPEPTKQHQPVQHHTAIVSGLKAYASLFVYTQHMAYVFTTTYTFGYGSRGLKTYVQLPFLRLPFAGLSMVYVFTVLSGFLLSDGPLRLARRGDLARAYDVLAGSAFRRGFRLFVPALVSVLMCAVCVPVGVFEPARRVWDSGSLMLHEELPGVVVGGVVWQVWDAVTKFAELLVWWNWDVSASAGGYSLHVWTLPVEFRCSMVLFLVLVVVCRFTVAGRLAVVVSLVLFAFWSGVPELSGFLSGCVLAELELVRQHHHGQVTGGRVSRLKSTVALVLFLTGAYCSSIPFAGPETDPMYMPLLAIIPDLDHTPKPDVVRSVGAALIVYGALWCTYLRPIFANTLTGYLGKLSFSIYLVHGHVIKALLYPLAPRILSVTGDGTQVGQTQLGVVMACVMGAGLTLPLTIWLADLFWRGVEMPIGRCVGTLEGVLVKKGAQGENGKAVRLKLQ